MQGQSRKGKGIVVTVGEIGDAVKMLSGLEKFPLVDALLARRHRFDPDPDRICLEEARGGGQAY